MASDSTKFNLFNQESGNGFHKTAMYRTEGKSLSGESYNYTSVYVANTNTVFEQILWVPANALAGDYDLSIWARDLYDNKAWTVVGSVTITATTTPTTTTTTTTTTVAPTTTTTTPQTSRPGPIYGVTGVGNVGDAQVTLSWDTPDDGGSPLTGFVIRMAAAYAWMWFPYPCPPNGAPVVYGYPTDAPSIEGVFLGPDSYWLFTPWATSVTLTKRDNCGSIGRGGTYEFGVAAVNAHGTALGWGTSTGRFKTSP